ncbi:MAG: hypothetical protein ACTSR1_00250 [Candidatus Heimdallarchaeota archaeon]
MPNVLINQYDFTHGELSELNYARSDLDIYKKSAARLRNVTVKTSGSVSRRFGTKYIDELLVNNDDFMITSFEYNEDESYLIVLTDLFITVYLNDEVVSTVISEYGFNVLRDKKLKFTSTESAVIITNENRKPTELKRGATSVDWSLDEISFKNLPTYEFNQDYDDIRFKLSDVKQGNQSFLDSSSAFFTEEYVGGTIVGIGTELGTEPGYARIIAYVSSTTVNVTILSSFDEGYNNGSGLLGTTMLITEPVFSDAKGWPISATFFESRLWFGGSKSLKNGIFGSVTNSIYDFDGGTGEPSDGIIRIVDPGLEIQNITSAKNLQIFTLTSEYAAFSQLNGALTPESASIKRQSEEGSNYLVQPRFFDNQTFFIKRDGKQLISLVYDSNSDSYQSIPVSVLSTNMIRDPRSISIYKGTKSDPFNYVFIVNDDGTLAVYQSFLEEKVSAFTLSDTADQSSGEFKDVTTVGSDIYFIVRRIINGSDKNYIEKLRWDIYTDSSYEKTYVTPTSIIDNLDHLNGLSVSPIGDGYRYEDQVVTDGEIELPDVVSDINVGLNYFPVIRTLPVSANLQQGPITYLNKKIVSVWIDYYESLGIYINDVLIPAREFGGELPYPPSDEQTGVYEHINFGDWLSRNYVEITQKDPLPMTIRGLGFKVNVSMV